MGGVQIAGNVTATLTNNSIYQTTGNAIHAPALVGTLNMTNNIVSVNTGTAVSLPLGGTSITSNYNLFDLRGAGTIANWKGTNFERFRRGAIHWASTSDSLVANPLFIDFDGPDNQLGFTTGDFSADDNFRLLSTSPAIDAGDPITPYSNEPAPNGNRVDMGAFGNSASSSQSPQESVQIISPNGGEKYEQGQQVR